MFYWSAITRVIAALLLISLLWLVAGWAMP